MRTAFSLSLDFLRLPRIISNLQGLCGHKEAAEEAAKQGNLISTIDQIAQIMGASPADSCNTCYMGRALEITKKVEGQVLEAPPSFIPF